MELSFSGKDVYGTCLRIDDYDDDVSSTSAFSSSFYLKEEFDSLKLLDPFPDETFEDTFTNCPKKVFESEIDSTSDKFCYSSNIDTWISQLKTRKILSLSQVKKLCEKVKDILVKESNVVELSSPITVCGDTHGQHYDLMELFKIAGEPPDVNFLFLGDYVDRGRYSVAVVSLLLALKVKYSNRITLLRGNHESRQTTQVYGFYDECFALYGDHSAWSIFMDAFDYLPVCALIDNNRLCMHGGLSPSFSTIDEIRALFRFGEIPHDGPISDIVWSDPSDRKRDLGFQNSPRGAGCMWGIDVSKHFTEANDIGTITRAHQVVNEGISLCHNRLVVTIFSAPNYCYRSGNLAGYIMLDGNKSEMFTFEAAPRNESSSSGGFNLFDKYKDFFF
ncbi:UNVERIFIED_CONTAM: hypothetical protein RMT77_009385 [Armadillidium vulgare]